jgi:hemerythrin superfamily protein
LEGVHNGSEAMSIFPKIKDMPPEEQVIARKQLLDYCKLDTYAMVKVWEALMEAVK